MRITVTTVYDNIPERDAEIWFDKVFKSTWAKDEFTQEQINEMREDFFLGEEIGAKTKDPDSPMTAHTTWRLK